MLTPTLITLQRMLLYILKSLPCKSDCTLEQVVKYGETYTIILNHIESPITLMFRLVSKTLINQH